MKNIIDSEELKKLKYSSEEWGYVFFFPNYKLIIPCRTILSDYYLKEKKIAEVLRSGHINDLIMDYEILKFKKHKYSFKITCQKGVTFNAIKILSNFLYDQRLLDLFLYHYKQIALTKTTELFLLRSYFPFLGEREISGCSQILNLGTSKETHILSSLNYKIDSYFSEIHYQYKRKNDNSEYKIKKFVLVKTLELKASHELISSYDILYKDLLDKFQNTMIEYDLNIDINQFIDNKQFKSKLNYGFFASYFYVKFRQKLRIIVHFNILEYYELFWYISFKGTYNEHINKDITGIIKFLMNNYHSNIEIIDLIEKKYRCKFKLIKIPKYYITAYEKNDYKFIDVLMHYLLDYEMDVKKFYENRHYKWMGEFFKTY